MPQILNYVNIEVTDGVNYVINAADNSLEYYINGTEALTSNWAVTMGAGSVAGMQLHMKYGAVVTLAGNHIFILGTQIPDGLADKDFDVFGFYNGSDWEISFLPDFQDSSIIDTANILDDAVTNDKLANMVRGTVKVGGASNAPTDLTANVAGQILIGDGTDVKSLAVTGDVGITGAGLTTIVADAVDNTKLANMVRGTVKVGGVANAPTDLVANTSAQILIGNGTDLISVPVTGDVTITAAGVTTVNPAIIPELILEAGIGTLSAQTIGTNCKADGDYSVSSGRSTMASGDYSHAIGNGTTASGDYSCSGGLSAQASGDYSIAYGNNAIASGVCSCAIGVQPKAKGDFSMACGNFSTSNIYGSYAISSGKFTIDGDAQRIEVQLKKATTDATPAYMLLGDGATEITIPTDCSMNLILRVLAVQNGGAGGTVGDTFSQIIKLAVANIAGVSAVVPTAAVTLANYSVEADDIIYEIPFKMAAFGGTVTVSVAANTLHVQVTGEATKNILWLCDVSGVMVGHTNFSI